MNTFGLKKLVYFDFLVADSTEKIVSSYAQHFPTLLESEFEKKFLTPLEAAAAGPLGPQPAGAPGGRKFFFKFWLQKCRKMLGIARNYFFSWICDEKIKINEFFQPKSVNFCLKNHFFTCLMVKEASSCFGNARNRFLDAKNGGIYSFLQKNDKKNFWGRHRT